MPSKRHHESPCKKGGYGRRQECKQITANALRKAATHRENRNGKGRTQRAAQGEKMTVEQPNDRQPGKAKRQVLGQAYHMIVETVTGVLRHYMQSTRLKQPHSQRLGPKSGRAPLRREGYLLLSPHL